MKHFDPRGAFPRAITGVRANAGDPAKVLADLAKAFEDFKQENDNRLKAKADVVIDEKVNRIEAAMGDMQKALEDQSMKFAAAQTGTGERVLRDREYTGAFQAYVKSDDIKAALNKGTDPAGGFLTPVEWDRTIEDRLIVTSPMRAIATVQQMSVAGFRKLFNPRGIGSGWVGETAVRPETTTQSFGVMTYTPGELYANPAATQQILDDAEVDIEQWLANEVEAEFAYQEGIAFVSGNGTNKPNGILTYVTGAANAAAHPWGAILTGVTAASATAITSDEIVQLVYSLPMEFGQNARFVMNRTTLSAIRRLKDTTGQYLWQPSFQADQPQTILGYPITEMAAMPSPAAAAFPIIFGDIRRTYLIVDRIGVRVLRDPFTNKPYVMFYTTKRVGGGLLNPDYSRVLRML